jgi:parvulin-like peptidyl-prolyl isomerase
MHRICKEPLVHFLLAGAVLFAVFEITGRQEEDGAVQREIVVTPGRIKILEATYEKTWTRKPTAEETEELIKGFVQQEIMYREALAMGLDRDDEIIRRRLRQKMEFFTKGLAQIKEPTDEELTEFLQTNAERYAAEPTYSFVQIYLDARKRKETLEDDLKQLQLALEQQGSNASFESMGDPSLLVKEMSHSSLADIARKFGPAFARGLPPLEEEVWSGPLSSVHGIHMVFITETSPGALPRLDGVRQRVRDDWFYERQQEAEAELNKRLRELYQVTVVRSESKND